jgi:hypothetical protein
LLEVSFANGGLAKLAVKEWFNLLGLDIVILGMLVRVQLGRNNEHAVDIEQDNFWRLGHWAP